MVMHSYLRWRPLDLLTCAFPEKDYGSISNIPCFSLDIVMHLIIPIVILLTIVMVISAFVRQDASVS